LDSFGVSASIVDVFRGPSVTRYELVPAEGVKISKITNLADDLALRLAASGVRIEAPIPNKAAIGIEVPNKAKASVYIREIIDTDVFVRGSRKSLLNVTLGKDITGNVICADLSRMPHLLIAGTTGSGKSVCINSMIMSILFNADPDEVKLLMIDPKQVEFTVYSGIPHLLVPVVSDPRKASGALNWAVTEMLKRYKIFSEKNVRDITGYNKLAQKTDELEKMNRIVIFIDELSDLMMVAQNEVEDAICRLAQMARAAGMHLVIATQRPSVDVITGVIKANIPSRIALSVSSQIDSRTIIDMAGAEKLLGYGDMLYNPVGISKPVRVQGCFVSDGEVERVVDFIKNQEGSSYDEEVLDEIDRQTPSGKKGFYGGASGTDGEASSVDEKLQQAVDVVVEAQMASTTLLQRKLSLGYARAARLIDELEERKIVGPFEGSKPRKVLISKQQWMEMCALSQDGLPDIDGDALNSPESDEDDV
ncbi:MAG: DNA translocase FtsK, partial [Clostridiales bacterium]|nr:DNA translocase FtsK [Clostridiales bacterium]